MLWRETSELEGALRGIYNRYYAEDASIYVRLKRGYELRMRTSILRSSSWPYPRHQSTTDVSRKFMPILISCVKMGVTAHYTSFGSGIDERYLENGSVELVARQHNKLDSYEDGHTYSITGSMRVIFAQSGLIVSTEMEFDNPIVTISSSAVTAQIQEYQIGLNSGEYPDIAGALPLEELKSIVLARMQAVGCKAHGAAQLLQRIQV